MDLNRQSNVNKRGSTSEMQGSPLKIQKTAFYLEDNTPVRTIEVTNLPDDVCHAYLRGYFEHDGPVEKVVINRKTESNKEECIAYVTFIRPEDAAKLIGDKSIRFKFNVKEAADMYQPKVDPNILNLEDVNDDCLLHIMSHLNLVDLVHFGKTSIRLQSVAKIIYEKKSSFSFGANTGDSYMNEINLPVVLEEIGVYIQEIEWHELNTVTLDILAKYCPNVTVIKLIRPSTTLNSIHFEKNKKFFAKVRRLHIKDSHLFDRSLREMMTPATLKTINLEGCHNIRGQFLPRHISKMEKLIHLRVINCTWRWISQLEGSIFDIQRAKKLYTFAVDMPSSYKYCLTSPPENLAKLKELQLDFSRFLQKDLKQLNFNGLTRLTKLTVTRMDFALLKQLFANFNNLITAISQINTLESLCISHIEINDETLNCLGSIQNLKQLKLNYVKNTIGSRLYTAIPVNLPHLTELSMFVNVTETNITWICETVTALPLLQFFSHSSMTWQLLDMILNIQLTRKQYLTMNVGISKLMFADPRKKQFDTTNKRSLTLSLTDMLF